MLAGIELLFNDDGYTTKLMKNLMGWDKSI